MAGKKKIKVVEIRFTGVGRDGESVVEGQTITFEGCGSDGAHMHHHNVGVGETRQVLAERAKDFKAPRFELV